MQEHGESIVLHNSCTGNQLSLTTWIVLIVQYGIVIGLERERGERRGERGDERKGERGDERREERAKRGERE